MSLKKLFRELWSMKFVAPAWMVFLVASATLGIVWLRQDQTLAEYHFATGWWQSTESVLLWTPISLTVLFSVGALVVRTQVLKTGAAESIAFNLLWGLGYIWVAHGDESDGPGSLMGYPAWPEQ